MKAFFRVFLLAGSIIIGCFFPGLHAYRELIRYFLMFMLFVIFLRLRPSWQSLHWSQAMNIVIVVTTAFAIWYLLRLAGLPQIALAAFFAAIAPTATSAPVIIGMLRGNVEYAVMAFFSSNLVIFFALPWLLPPVLGYATPGVAQEMLLRIGAIILIPMVLAGLFRLLLRRPRAEALAARLGPWSFYAWLVILFLVAANASHFLGTQRGTGTLTLVAIAIVSLGVCAFYFALGHGLGYPHMTRECSQVLGQKNTSFTIYLALTYANPTAALGPTFYLIWHNLWNAWQLYRVQAAPAADAAGAAEASASS